MKEIKYCSKGDYSTNVPLAKCPQCGTGRLRSAKQVRRFGWFFVALSGFLVALMGLITFPADGYPSTGTVYFGAMSGVFVLAITFGLVAFALGIWSIRKGKISGKLLRRIVFVLVVLLAVMLFLRWRMVAP
ncbi:MAG: hypothetical protein ABSH41_05760 [Syntrophobacteraceae bacterium]|jgi:hypothetical protein